MWAIITPDKDIYEEDMSAANGDLVSFVYGGPGLGGAVPPGIPAAAVYGFRAMTAARYQQLMQQARIYAAGVRASMGLPGIAGGRGAVVPVAGGPVAAAPVAAAGEEVWISLENLSTYSVGDVVIPKGVALPAGHVTLGGDKALVPINGGSRVWKLKKIKESELQ